MRLRLFAALEARAPKNYRSQCRPVPGSFVLRSGAPEADRISAYGVATMRLAPWMGKVVGALLEPIIASSLIFVERRK
jgi:hypothetical protein